jgi:hypothetical protein
MAVNARATTYSTATIANAATVSGAVDCTDGRTAFAIVTPAALTGTAMTFQASHDGTTYNPITDTAGAAYSITVAASRYIPITSAHFAGARYIKVVSGSSEGASRAIIVVRRFLS